MTNNKQPTKEILIIEDDLTLHETISNLLELEGYIIISATDGNKGINLAKKHLPDLIICDIMMPEKDGIDVINELQNDNKTELIPFIFLTAKAELKDIRKGMLSGADDYITKPFNNEDLLRSIEIRLEKHKNLTNKTKTNKEPSSKNEELAQKLTKREKEIIKYFCKGLSCKQISEKLFISFHTVDSHRKNIEKKLKLKSISSVVHFAHENNLQ